MNKRYKLKKDLPTFKAGNMFRLEDTGSLWWHGRDNGQPETKSVVKNQLLGTGEQGCKWGTVENLPATLPEIEG